MGDFLGDLARLITALGIICGAVLMVLRWCWVHWWRAPARAALRRLATIETQVERNGHISDPPTLRDELHTILQRLDDIEDGANTGRAEMALWTRHVADVVEGLQAALPEHRWPTSPRRDTDPPDYDGRPQRRKRRKGDER
jgi:hypothetical protein